MFSSRRWTIVFVSILFFVIPKSQPAQVNSGNASSIYELSAGTQIELQMDNEINSKSAGVNDTFTAVVSTPVTVKDVVVLRIGAIVEGRMIRAESAASGGRNGKLEVVFETLLLDNGSARPIEAVLLNKLEQRRSKTVGILSAIGGTAIGAIIGYAARSDNGALIGAGIGGGIGTGVGFLRKGKDVKIEANEKFVIELTKNVRLPVKGC